MKFKSIYYFQLRLEASTAIAIAASETDYFPMRKIIDFSKEFNEKVKSSTNSSLRNEQIFYPNFNYDRVVQISESDFDFFSIEGIPDRIIIK